MHVILLYLIEILHQTTTADLKPHHTKRCILSKFYIKPQQRCRFNVRRFGCILSKFYIKPQPEERPAYDYLGCILSKFYIKPQQRSPSVEISAVVSYRNSTSNHNIWLAKATHKRLYLIEILHQTTTCGKCEDCLRRCILSKFYIKPQRSYTLCFCFFVVSYRNSTSNHNIRRITT